jgi:hypothetical protein
MSKEQEKNTWRLGRLVGTNPSPTPTLARTSRTHGTVMVATVVGCQCLSDFVKEVRSPNDARGRTRGSSDAS